MAHLRDSQIPAPDPSQISEQQVGFALLRALQVAASQAEYNQVMYRRTSTKEVDFVGPIIGQTGFEGKYVDDGWRSEAKTIKSQFGRGVLATRSVLDLSEDVLAIPASMSAFSP